MGASARQAVSRPLLALYLLLGLSAGTPFALYNAVLLLRLARHGVDLAAIGFFAWVALLPAIKFLWAPLIDRVAVPGFGHLADRRQGWIMLAMIGVVGATAAMAATADDRSLTLTALFATLLALAATTLEIAADGWRIALCPTQETQGPIVAAYVWGYRGAMVAAGGGTIAIAGWANWGAAYGAMAILLLLVLAGIAVLAPYAARRVGEAELSARRPSLDVRPIESGPIEAYRALFRRHGRAMIPLLGFVAFYRMGDVLTLTLSHPLWNARGYGLNQIAVADGAVAVLASIAGVAAGGWMAARFRLGPVLAAGAIGSAIGNWVFVWLWHRPPADFVLFTSAAIDQFAHGFEGAAFVVYLSLLVDPREASAHYALLSGWAFLLPRLLAGASGAIAQRIGYDGFFLLSGGLSAAAMLFLPFVARIGERASHGSAT